ncbi:hypothetical protein MTO96_026872 [Rhipicephalus appendiculatus]
MAAPRRVRDHTFAVAHRKAVTSAKASARLYEFPTIADAAKEGEQRTEKQPAPAEVQENGERESEPAEAPPPVSQKPAPSADNSLQAPEAEVQKGQPANQVLSLAVHLTIQAADLAEQLADQFAARDTAQLPAVPPPAALQCPASCHQPEWIAVQKPAPSADNSLQAPEAEVQKGREGELELAETLPSTFEEASWRNASSPSCSQPDAAALPNVTRLLVT